MLPNASMSFSNPYKDFVTLTGQIEQDLEDLLWKLTEHKQIHPETNIEMHIDIINDLYEKFKLMNFPKTVTRNNQSHV